MGLASTGYIPVCSTRCTLFLELRLTIYENIYLKISTVLVIFLMQSYLFGYSMSGPHETSLFCYFTLKDESIADEFPVDREMDLSLFQFFLLTL